MTLDDLVRAAARLGASDLHLEPGLAPAYRVDGALVRRGRPPPVELVERLAATILDGEDDELLARRGSVDLARPLGGRRCRINVFRTSRGTGMAIRLLPRDAVTLRTLNLHPDLARLVEHEHGLVLVSGPTGSGKSSTLAALLQAVNLTRACHVLTIEQPIEFDLASRQAFIRQREVGRDTPSFSQALLDATREDPDVLMVGELRDRETMRLVLDVCETGHLVLATLHSATTTEALQRIVSAFPAVEQPSVSAQLADVLRGVVCQRLVHRRDIGLRVPECELLVGTDGVRGVLRQGQLFKLRTALETGARHGMWTYERYRAWLAARHDWWVPEPEGPVETEGVRDAPGAGEDRPRPETPAAADEAAPPDRIVVLPPREQSLDDILSELDDAT